MMMKNVKYSCDWCDTEEDLASCETVMCLGIGQSRGKTGVLIICQVCAEKHKAIFTDVI